MVCPGSQSQFVPPDVRGDMFRERRQFTVAPIFVEDVELQSVALKLEVIQCGHGVGVIASPADHAAKLVADFLDDEELLRRAYAIAQPYP